MDYPLNELDSCIFNYLICHADEPRSMVRTYNDLIGEEGHRCCELKNPAKREHNKYYFITVFHSIANKFENIQKIYKDNKPYLMFSTSTVLSNKSNTESPLTDFSSLLSCDRDVNFRIECFDDFIDYLINNSQKDFNLTELLYNGESVLQYLVKHNDTKKLKYVLSNYDVNIDNNYDMLVKSAIEINNAKILKELLDYKFNKMKNDIQSREIILKGETEKLEKDMKEMRLLLNTLKIKNNNLTTANKRRNENGWSTFTVMATIIINYCLFYIFTHYFLY